MTVRERIADAMRLKDAEIRGATVLPWDQLTDTDRARWLALSDAGEDARAAEHTRARFATSARVHDGTLYFDNEAFPFHLSADGPSVEQLAPGGPNGPPLHLVTITVPINGDVTNIARETREPTIEELLRITEQRLAVARQQFEAVGEDQEPPDA